MNAADQRGYRLTSIDMLRGLVIVIMAIDHTRDFFSTAMSIDPMNDPNVGAAAGAHALDHAFLRAGVRVPLRHQRRAHGGAQDARGARQVPADARPVADLRRDLHHLDGGARSRRAASSSSAARRWRSCRSSGPSAPAWCCWRALQFLGPQGVPRARRDHRARPQRARRPLAGEPGHTRHQPAAVGGAARVHVEGRAVRSTSCSCIRCCRGSA